LYQSLGAGVPVSPERACEIIGPFLPVAPPDVNVAVVNVYSAGAAGTIYDVINHRSIVHMAVATFEVPGIVHVLLFSVTVTAAPDRL
jgi:hypothetical protein